MSEYYLLKMSKTLNEEKIQEQKIIHNKNFCA